MSNLLQTAERRADAGTLSLLEGIDDLLRQHKAQIETDADALESAGHHGAAATIRADHLGGAIFSEPTVAGALRSIVDGALDQYAPEPSPVRLAA